MGLLHRSFFFLELLLNCLVDLLRKDALGCRHEFTACSYERPGYRSELFAKLIAKFLDVVEGRCDIRHNECCIRHRLLKFMCTDHLDAASKVFGCIKSVTLVGSSRLTTTSLVYTFIPVYIGEVKLDIVNRTKIKIVSVDLTIRSSLSINFVSHD